MEKGMSEANARREAELRFGDIESTRSHLEAIDRSRAELARGVGLTHPTSARIIRRSPLRQHPAVSPQQHLPERVVSSAGRAADF